MLPVPKPKGNGLIQRFLRALHEALNPWTDVTILPSGLCNLKRSGENIVFDFTGLANSINSGISAAVEFSFQLIVSDSTHLRVRTGTINSAVATGVSPGDTPVFTVAIAGTSGVVVGKITLNSSWDQTAFEIYCNATLPANTTTLVYFRIGSYSKTGAVLSCSNDIRASFTYLLLGQRDTDVPLVLTSPLAALA